MAHKETVTINCENHSQVLKESLWKFLITKYRVEDVVWGGSCLKVGFSLKAHQLILDIFLPTNRQVDLFTLTDDDRFHLEAMLEFMYKGTVTVQRDRLDGLLLLAKDFEFKMLVDGVLKSSRVQDDDGIRGSMLMTEVEINAENVDSNPKSSNNVLQSSIAALPSSTNVLTPSNSVVTSSNNVLTPSSSILMSSSPVLTSKLHFINVQACADVEDADLKSCGLNRTNPITFKRNLAQIQHGKPSKAIEEDSGVQAKRRRTSIQALKLQVKTDSIDDVIRAYGSGRPLRSSHLRSKSGPRVAFIKKSALHTKKSPMIKCDECDYESTNAGVIKSHKSVVHFKEKPFGCSKCDFVTCWKSILKRHVSDWHPISGRFFCSICKDRFDTGAEVDAHMASHEEVGTFRCPLCVQAFTQNKFLLNHMARSHAAPGPGTPTCDVCKKSFKTRHALVAHTRVHTQERPHKCSHCDRHFNHASNRNSHVARVHGNPDTCRTFSCEICGKLFKALQDLMVHQRTHSQERPYKCPQCDRCFKRKSSIKGHVSRIHTRERASQAVVPATIPCEVCDKMFKTHQQMIEHTRVHTLERPYLCPHCDSRFSRASSRSSHIARAHSEGPGSFSCDTCNKLFKLRPDLVAHQHTHAEEPKYKCPHCDKRFRHATNKRSHVVRVHSRGPRRFSCEICGKLFQMRSDLVVHQRTHSREPTHECPHCDKRFKSKWGMSVHVTRDHNPLGTAPALLPVNIVCDVCNKGFKTNHEMIVHRRIHTQEQPFKCPHCEKRFNHSSNRRSHVARLHSEGPGSFACHSCERRFKTRADLVTHERTHSAQGPKHKCPHCEKGFNAASNKRTHIARAHTQGPGTFSCDFCEKRFKTRPDLVQHRRTHTQEKPHECPRCDKRFNRASSVKLHVARHHGEGDVKVAGKTHKCPQCDYAAVNNGLVTVHLDVIHGVGPGRFTCGTCEKRCNSRVALERHTRTHTKEKPFKCQFCSFATGLKASLKQHVDTLHGYGLLRCEICDKSFSAMGQLDRHRRSHTQEKPFQCPHCSHRTAWKDNLTKHVAAVHGTVKYACELCDKVLNSTRQLGRHRLSHAKKKSKPIVVKMSMQDGSLSKDCRPSCPPVICDICGEHFLTMEELGPHRLTHPTEASFTFLRYVDSG